MLDANYTIALRFFTQTGLAVRPANQRWQTALKYGTIAAESGKERSCQNRS